MGAGLPKKHSLSTYATKWKGVIQIAHSRGQREEGVSPYKNVCAYTYTHALTFFHVLAACLSYGVLYYSQKFNLTFIQICSSEMVIFLQRDQRLYP